MISVAIIDERRLFAFAKIFSVHRERERRKKCVHEFDYRMMHLHLDRKHCRQSLMHDVAH